MNDPREILKAAGVEVPEVEKCYRDFYGFGKRYVPWSALDAILALSRLVAKYKWQRDEATSEVAPPLKCVDMTKWREALDRRWDEHEADHE
jgi:hypothetical protein